MALSLTHLGESIFAAMINRHRDAILSLPGLRLIFTQIFFAHRRALS